MLIVEQAQFHPHYCAVTGRSEGPFFDTGNTLVGYDHRVYVSTFGVDQLAKAAGYQHPDVTTAQLDEIAHLKANVARLEDELLEADRFRDSVEFTFDKLGRKVDQKVGRPRQIRRGPDANEAEELAKQVAKR